MGAAVFSSLRFCNDRTLDQFSGFLDLRFSCFVILTGGRFFAGAEERIVASSQKLRPAAFTVTRALIHFWRNNSCHSPLEQLPSRNPVSGPGASSAPSWFSSYSSTPSPKSCASPRSFRHPFNSGGHQVSPFPSESPFSL